MYARILVAVDGSAGSTHALEHAVGLARSLSAVLRIVHVVDMGLLPYGPELSLDIGPLIEARRAAAANVLASAGDTAQSSGITIESALVDLATPSQSVAEALAEDAAAWSADLVVLGTEGRRGVERWLLGSVAEGVARRAAMPVLLVPAAAVAAPKT
jgi:nucleotide-binding universal stress UspA family protein